VGLFHSVPLPAGENPPISSNPTIIEASSTQRGERSKHNFCIMAFSWGKFVERVED